ncbi:MAG: hypothetical protein IAE77_09130 [Prosthecobacter sp.]|uniref:hypothetical protein n=1 Tax=Prosthecobacter sp. TaxID=1965333 RepID=UPI0019F8A76D|nr:hypothetical protein [Prosthecobacter sp.]MBE2283604.1 hypothetical protein [Prosthecobacter sp.]
MADPDTSEGLADDVVPELAPAPTIVRRFEPAPWHRPRKQHIRKHQWNHEIIEHIVKKRGKISGDAVLRVFGLPSSEYLDLLSMRDLCDEYGFTVSYLGFNSSYRPDTASGSAEVSIAVGG